ncbi:MAG: DNA-3-methyladenine glycosylase [Chitinophagaceae bacterium]|nr:DNA-3-methyladenine glycosylase [Chitinophagaceae bacterium]
MGKLPKYFYQREDVLKIAHELLGKLLVTNFDGLRTSGRIVECEAYAGTGDRASHVYGGRRTTRVEPMYAAGGIAYVYLCYGIHHLFNVVTNVAGTPHAVLIRGIEPVEGIDMMQLRTPSRHIYQLGKGPGKLTRALGIHTIHSGYNLQSRELHLYDDGFVYPENKIIRSPRIGVDYAGDDALLPYRFSIEGNKSVSK